jgi:hypothetical protein
VLVDAGLDRLSDAQSGNALGVLLWREDLADWMAGASARARRAAWLAGWSAGATRIDCFAIGLLGALTPDRLAAVADGDSALASRLLYAWPARGAPASLADTDADDAGLVALLQKIAAFAGHRETPCVVPLDEGGTRRLEALMPVLGQQADAFDEEGAAWLPNGSAAAWRRWCGWPVCCR